MNDSAPWHERARLTGHVPHFWSPPARFPDDLPPHEQWVRQMPVKMNGTPSPHPPQVAPGFARAWALGLCPPPAPATPPTPLPGLNSVTGVLLGVGVPIASFLLWVQALDVLTAPGMPPGVDLGARIGLGVWGFVVWVLMLLGMRRFSARTEAEYEAGYTSLAAQTGLWAINPFTGKAWRAPDPNVLPYGWYPSPYFPGALQLWEGPDWALLGKQWYRRNRVRQVFRPPAVDFLGVGNVAIEPSTSPGLPGSGGTGSGTGSDTGEVPFTHRPG